MTTRPTFTLRELRLLKQAVDYLAWRRESDATHPIGTVMKSAVAQAARDAAAFARLRRRVQDMVEKQEEKKP